MLISARSSADRAHPAKDEVPGSIPGERSKLGRFTAVPVADRLYANLIPLDHCLIWMGGTVQNGYGVLKDHGKTLLVHRLAWELEVGPIPEGYQIDHVKARGCQSILCCYVGHLEPVTQLENMRRAGQVKYDAAAMTRWVVDLRDRGMTYYQIADLTGLSRAYAHRLYHRAVR